jgi:uncharacterized protein
VPPEPEELAVPLTPPQRVPATTALLWPPPQPTAPTVVLAHGAGTDMRHPHLRRHASDLVAGGVGVALFDFAYRAAGGRAPDPAPRLLQAWRDVVAAVAAAVPTTSPLVVGGRSMGGRVASVLAAEVAVPPAGADADGRGGALSRVRGVACLAYPLHPPGRPDRLRVDHWPALRLPVLLVSGSRDAMAPLGALREAVAAHLPPGLATLHVVEGADHSMHVRAADGRDPDAVLDEVAAAVLAWLPGAVGRSPG